MASDNSIAGETNISTQGSLNAQQINQYNLVFRSMKRSHDMFLHNYEIFPDLDLKA